jgi:hypothetical protein
MVVVVVVAVMVCLSVEEHIPKAFKGGDIGASVAVMLLCVAYSFGLQQLGEEDYKSPTHVIDHSLRNDEKQHVPTTCTRPCDVPSTGFSTHSCTWHRPGIADSLAQLTPKRKTSNGLPSGLEFRRISASYLLTGSFAPFLRVRELI